MRTRLLAAVLAATAVVGSVVMLRASHAAAQVPSVSTASVEKGPLSDMVSQYGTLTYRARPDGSPYTVINRARGIYTDLPEAGDKVACGDVLYRVNDKPVLLLCGSTPAYRSLSEGDSGPDVAELNANLRLAPAARFSSGTAAALRTLQSRLRVAQTGSLDLGRAVFLPKPLRIVEVAGELGATARPGAQVLGATSDRLEVHVDLDPSQQNEVKIGDRAQITLPGNRSVTGKVDRLGRVAVVAAGQDATIPAFITLDHPRQAGDLDKAPVHVNITTKGVENALSVPVSAIVGRSGGGYAVEVVHGDGHRAVVAVKPGLYDTADGRVQVEGDLREGDRVVVPSS
ncbi:MAG TPA: hypothetical protein VGQ38_17170 [Gaiellaceae bacterium]|nr:hypothetical protein [Gaiellaceae bacterium]